MTNSKKDSRPNQYTFPDGTIIDFGNRDPQKCLDDYVKWLDKKRSKPVDSKKDSELERVRAIFVKHTEDGLDTELELFDTDAIIEEIATKYITKEESDRRVLEQFNKSVELTREIFMENFHYRIMCGEIKDPTGKIDVNKALVEYQELEPERRKFADYIESLRELLNGDKNG